MEVSKKAVNLIKSIYKMFIDTDANLVEINPLILTKSNEIVCLDAKMNFDENALFKHPEILDLRDLNEEEDTEIHCGDGTGSVSMPANLKGHCLKVRHQF